MPQITVDNTTELARYDFSGSALPTEWGILAQGTGQSVSVASSVMTIVAGTTASATTTVRCSNKVNVKFYSRFVVSLSQRIANQNVYLELTNAAGTTFARYDFNGTTATSVQCQTGNQGTNNTAVTVTCPTTASYGTFDIYADTNDVVFSSVASNSNAAKAGIAAFDRLILDPDEDYYLQVRVVNGGTAPASSTSINVDAVVLQDLTGLKVDIIRGDGTGAISSAAPVQVMNVPAATQSGTWTVQPGNTANTTAWLTRQTETLGTATALAALNGLIAGALNGVSGIGMVVTAVATPVGMVLTPYMSYDGGTNYVATKFYDPILENIEDTIQNASLAVGFSRGILVDSGVTHVKVQATGWTSGSATVRLSATNAQGLMSLKSGAQHDAAAGTYVQMVGAHASSTAPTAVSTNGDAVKLWATTSGALNVADGGGTLSVDDGGGTLSVDGTVTTVAGNNVFYNESTTAQAASATVTGTTRDVAVAAGTTHRYTAFNASGFADVAGTLRIEMSNDNTTWRRATADTAVGANAVVHLSVPIMTRYYRAVYINGGTIQTAFMLNTSLTAA